MRHSAISSDNHHGFSNVNIEEILKPAWGGIWEKEKKNTVPIAYGYRRQKHLA